MDTISPDIPVLSERIRLASTHNRTADANLKMALVGMQKEHYRTIKGHTVEQNKVRKSLSFPSDSKSLDVNYLKVARGRMLASGRLLPSRSEIPSRTTKVRTSSYLTDAQHEKSFVGKYEMKDQVVKPLRIKGQRMKTFWTLQTEAKHEMERRRSVSLNESELSGRNSFTLGSKNHSKMSSMTTICTVTSSDTSEDEADSVVELPKKKVVAARPHSAVTHRDAAPKEPKGRRMSVDMHSVFQNTKRKGILDPLLFQNRQSSDYDGSSTCHNDVSRDPTKRVSETEGIIKYKHPPTLPPGSVCGQSDISSVSALFSDSSLGAPDEVPLQPYSIGRIAIRDSKGAFEQKTGLGGLRAWAGFPNNKPVNPPLWNLKNN